jgi:hypothetical protein
VRVVFPGRSSAVGWKWSVQGALAAARVERRERAARRRVAPSVRDRARIVYVAF